MIREESERQPCHPCMTAATYRQRLIFDLCVVVPVTLVVGVLRLLSLLMLRLLCSCLFFLVFDVFCAAVRVRDIWPTSIVAQLTLPLGVSDSHVLCL